MKHNVQHHLPVFKSPPTILIVEARFYDDIADYLYAGAEAALKQAGCIVEKLSVPGALEIPGAIMHAARSGNYDAFVALGCVIRGETYHFEVVSNESARGIMILTFEGVAVGNGILTIDTKEQALERADPSKMNKGAGAAAAALNLLAIKQKFEQL